MIHFIHTHNVLFRKEIKQKFMVELMYLTAKNLTKIDLKYVELITRLAFTFTDSPSVISTIFFDLTASESLAMTDGEKSINAG